jgi:hypothetical protein
MPPIKNPLKDLFKRKYTTYYTVDDLNEEQVNFIRGKYDELQANPENFNEDQVNAINELNYRLSNPVDPMLKYRDELQAKYPEGTPGVGAFTSRKTPEDISLDVAKEAMARKKFKTSHLYGRIEGHESPKSLTNVEDVLTENKESEKLEIIKNEINTRGRERYKEYFGYDLYKDKDDYVKLHDNNAAKAFNSWYHWALGGLHGEGDEELLEDILKKSPKIRQAEDRYYKKTGKTGLYMDENGNITSIKGMLMSKWRASLEKGTLEKDFFNIDIKDIQRDFKERNKKVYDFAAAMKHLDENMHEYIPYADAIYGAPELFNAYKLAKRFDEDPASMSEEELNELMAWVEQQDYESTATWGATLVEMLASMPGFFVEIGTSGGLVKVGSKASIKVADKFLKKYIKEGIETKIQRELKNRTATRLVKGATEKVAITTVGTSLSGDVETAKIRNLMPGYELLDGELFKIYNGMDELSAERQAYWGTTLEFGSEMVGGVPSKLARWIGKTKVGKYTGDKFIKSWDKLGLPNKEYLMSTAVMRAFKKVNPGASNKDIEKIFRTFGYHGVFEEMFEERVGDAGRHILNLLSTTKDENGKPLIEGFENKNWVWQNPTWEQLSLELVAFSVPGIGKRKLSKAFNSVYEARENKKIDKFNENNPELGEQITEIENEVEKNDKRLEVLQNKSKGKKENLSDAEIEEVETIIETKQKKNILQFIRGLIIKDPSLKEEVSLDINLEEEMKATKEQLENEGVTLEGEGLSSDINNVNILGFTMFNNFKLKLGLRKGADLDTAIEEYYGLYYRGGLSNEQSDVFAEHYDTYKTDENYRIEINQFINDMMEENGMSDKMIPDVSQTLTEQELFEKEGKSYEYKSIQEDRGGAADKTFQFISNMFNRAFKRFNVSSGVADIYRQAQERKQTISRERAALLKRRREQRQEEKEEKPKAEEAPKEEVEVEKKPTKKEERRKKRIEKKRKKLKPETKPTLDETFEDEAYEDVPEAELEDLPEIVPPPPKKVKERKEISKKIKSKPRLFNFLNRRAKKIVPKEIEKISPVATRELKIKIEKEVMPGGSVLPDDPRQPLEILRDILGDEQFQEITGIYSGPILEIEMVEPKIIETLKEKFEPLPYESLDFFDVIPEKKQEEILKEVEKKVGKETIKPIRDLKKPTKPKPKISEDETFDDATYENVPETILEELPNLEKPKKKSKKSKKKDTSYQIVSADKKENTGTFIIAGDAANLNLKGEQEDFGIRYPRTYKGWAVTKIPAIKIKNQADKGNNIIAITTLTDPANSMKNNPTFIEALKRAAIENVGVRKFNQLYRKNKKNIYKTATEAKVNMKQVGRETSVPDFNQIAGKIVAVAEVEDIRTGDDRKVKHPAYDHEINFKSYRELKEPILLKDYVGELKEGDKRIDYPFLMAKTYNLAITNKESPTTNLFKQFLDTGDNSLFGVKTTGIQVASPQIKEIGLDEAVKGIKSKDLINFHRFVADLEVEQGLKSTTKSSLGEWETGAEPSVYTEITSEIDVEQLKYIAAVKGLSRNQETILNFVVQENGPDSMYEVEIDVDTKNLKTYTKMLTDAGILFKTLPIQGNKFNLVVVDEGNNLVDLFKEASDVKEIKQRTGKASFIGAFGSRQKADKEYLKIITEYEERYPERYSAVLRNNISNLRPRFNKNLLPKKQKAQVSYQLKPADQPLELSDETRRERFIRKYINSLKRIDKTVGLVRDADELTDPYKEAKLFPGKVSAELEDFNNYIEKDFLIRLMDAGFDVESFGEYLYARHAEERNKKVHEDDATFEGTGSGMAREDITLEDGTIIEGYKSILEKYRGTGIVKFAREFDNKIIKKRLRILRDSGLISQETYNKFTKDSPYKFYVPLKGGVDKKQQGQGVRGFSITGKDIKRKRGRNSRALNPFVVAISDYANSVVRSGKNRVAQKLYLLALENPSSFWSARGKRYIPRFDKAGDLKFFEEKQLGNEEVQAVVDGKLKIITITDKGLLESFKNLGTEKSYKVMEKVNSFLRKAYTTYNPDFILGNFIRDIQTAMVNIQASAPDKKIGRKVFKDVMSGGPMRAIYRSMRDKGDAKLSVNKKKLDAWSKYYQEMRKEGATVGWFTNRKIEDKLKELDKIIKRHKGKNPMVVMRAIGKFAEDFNMAIEQATRLSAYKNLREAGLSKADAAIATRDLTVDFNQKGQEGALFRASYLFSNASMQGTYILANSIYKSKSARRMVMAITMQSFILNIINSMLMDDPDEDEYPWTDGIPDYEKDSYIMYPLPNGQMFKLQIGWGLNIFHTLGNVMADGVVAISRGRKPKHTNNIKRVVEAFGNAASPIGFGTSGISSFAPTAYGTKPLWEIIDNKKFTGAPIANKWADKPRAASQETFPGVNPYTKMATDWISEITGGGPRKGGGYKGGLIEINPEWVDHFIESWGGGPYRTSRNLYTTGYDLMKFGKIKKIKNVPIIRKLLTEPDSFAANSKMYDMYNVSSYTRFSNAERDDFNRYIKILIDSNIELLRETSDKKERNRIDRRIKSYKSKQKSFHKNQGKLK